MMISGIIQYDKNIKNKQTNNKTKQINENTPPPQKKNKILSLLFLAKWGILSQLQVWEIQHSKDKAVNWSATNKSD